DRARPDGVTVSREDGLQVGAARAHERRLPADLRPSGARLAHLEHAGGERVGAGRGCDREQQRRERAGEPRGHGPSYRSPTVARHGALVRVTLADGRLVQGVVSPAHPVFTVPPRPRALDVVRDYVRLGVAHILAGPDHLLFVFGLVLLAGTARRLLVTVSAFTLGHSIT